MLFVISGSLPKVPYLTYIDAFFLVSFLFTFLTIVELVVVHQAAESHHAARSLRIRMLSRWAYPLAYVLCNLATVWVFFRH
jgi:hypothetical protein